MRPAETGEGVVADMPVDDDTSATILRVAMAEAMRELSPSHREVLNETILRDRTVNQAAEVLGIPPLMITKVIPQASIPKTDACRHASR